MKIFFSGIGGIGMSGLAGIFNALGFEIIGSDIKESTVTKMLNDLGIHVFIGQKAENIENTKPDLLIKTNALPDDHIELVTARKLNIPILSYPQGLGIISNILPSIGITGTHGKTSTTAIVANILMKADYDIFALIGTLFKPFNNTNFKIAKINNTQKQNLANQVQNILTTTNTKFTFTRELFKNYKKDYSLPYFIFEADEYKDAFLNHTLDYLIITAVDYDHLDYFKTHEHYLTSFATAILNTKKAVILNKQDKIIQQILDIAISKLEEYNSTRDKDQKRNLPQIIDYSEYLEQAQNSPLYLKTQFLIEDLASALGLANLLNIKSQDLQKGIKTYKGAWRRFEIIRDKNPTTINDYAHNPKKILYASYALLDYAKTNNLTNLIIYWEPHQYNRTYNLQDEYAKSLFEILKAPQIKEFYITDVFAARSTKEEMERFNTQIFIKNLKHKLKQLGASDKQIQKLKYAKGAEYTLKKLQNHTENPQLLPENTAILILSAGTLGSKIYTIAN